MSPSEELRVLYAMEVMEEKMVGNYLYKRVPTGWIMFFYQNVYTNKSTGETENHDFSTPIFIPYIPFQDIDLGSTV